MSRLTRLLSALALVATGSFARADELRLVAPAAGATLRGGSVAELQWSADALPAGAEEWEGFLSVNGGRYYAFRVTPHLDIQLRRVTFTVPNVDTHDARILIRAGDEERETPFEQQGSFSIVRDPHAAPLVPGLVQHGHGEAARPGEAAVLAWAEGPRSGVGVTQQASAALPSPIVRLPEAIGAHGEVAELAPAITQVAAPSIARAARTADNPHARKPGALPIAVDLLLVCHRRNI
jgi:hypothetical protein